MASGQATFGKRKVPQAPGSLQPPLTSYIKRPLLLCSAALIVATAAGIGIAAFWSGTEPLIPASVDPMLGKWAMNGRSCGDAQMMLVFDGDGMRAESFLGRITISSVYSATEDATGVTIVTESGAPWKLSRLSASHLMMKAGQGTREHTGAAISKTIDLTKCE